MATFSASDPDADADDIEWSLDGRSTTADFEIDGGVLTFKESPDFEIPTDRDEVPDTEAAGDQGKGDNVYKVTVQASGGEQRWSVTVTERGRAWEGDVRPAVQPQATQGPEGLFSDEDGSEGPSWQWSRGCRAWRVLGRTSHGRHDGVPQSA